MSDMIRPVSDLRNNFSDIKRNDRFHGISGNACVFL